MSTINHTHSNSRLCLIAENLEQPEILLDIVQMLLGDVLQYLPDDLDGEDFAEESSVIYLAQQLCDQTALKLPKEFITAKIKDALLMLKESNYLRDFAYPHHMH